MYEFIAGTGLIVLGVFLTVYVIILFAIVRELFSDAVWRSWTRLTGRRTKRG